MSANDETPASQPGAEVSGETERLTEEATGPLDELQAPLILSPMPALDSEEDARRTKLCEAAIGYARRGFRVIPVRWVWADGNCSCDRGEECPSPGKHPVHQEWQKVGTADPLEVASWWRPEPEGIATEWFPRANIGIVTGRGSGCFVLDVDTYAGGSQTLAGYERRNGDLPETRVHSTGRGGTHYFFAQPDFEVRNSAARVLGKGLDIRGENGFVVAPPSASQYGPYELVPAHDIDPAPAPAWLLDALRSYDKGQLGTLLSGAAPTEATGAALRYAQAAVAANCEEMRTASQGTRNDTLNRCAFALGTLGGAGLLTEETAYASLREAALAAGLGDGEIRGTFLQGWRAGLDNPRHIQWNILQTDWPVRPRTEFGLADRMADHYGDTLRWCPELGTWMRYENGVWVTDVKQAGEWAAQAMLRRLEVTEALSYDEEKLQVDGADMPSPREDFMEWVAKVHKRQSVTAAATLAAGLPLMRMARVTFDADPLLLNCKNGVVDLSTGEFLPHSPEARMTLQCEAFYHPDDHATLWESFLRQVQPEPEMRAYLQRAIGYCATALTSEQIFFLMHGAGANGKGVFLNVIMHILSAYAQVVPTETLMASSVDGRIPNDIARMAGRRMLSASESTQGKALDEQRIKQLTGGDIIAARHMRAEYFEFRPVGKIILTTNHLPKLSDDAATWRRIHVIPWPVVIPEHERDGFLQQKLIERESAGILNWIVQGAIAWREMGLCPPQAVYDAREAYKAEEDIIGQFYADCLEEVEPVNGAIGRSSTELYALYEAWCHHEKLRPLGRNSFTQRLEKKTPKKRANGWTGFPGVQAKGLSGMPEGGASAVLQPPVQASAGKVQEPLIE